MGASNNNMEVTYSANESSPQNHTGFSTEWGFLVFGSVLCFTEIPCICLAMYALCLHRKSNHASVFIINLLLSDLLQIFALIVITYTLHRGVFDLSFLVYSYAFTTGTYFMACIALERYILISHPLWHRSHCTAKCSCCVYVFGWLETLLFFAFKYALKQVNVDGTYLVVIRFLIPYFLVVFSVVGAWRALSHSISVTSYKRKLVLGTLSLVLLNYTVVVFPVIILSLTNAYHLVKLFFILCYVNPLADCLLYVFTHSDTDDIMSTFPCCRRLDRGQQSRVSQTASNQMTAISTTL